jgi:hypothetical protein
MAEVQFRTSSVAMCQADRAMLSRSAGAAKRHESWRAFFLQFEMTEELPNVEKYLNSAASSENSNFLKGGGSAVSLRVLCCVEVAFSNGGAEGILPTGYGVTPTGSLRPFSRKLVGFASPYTQAQRCVHLLRTTLRIRVELPVALIKYLADATMYQRPAIHYVWHSFGYT